MTLPEAALTHLPDSVWVAVRTSDAAKVETVADQVPPTLTVAVPIEEPLLITLIEEPLIPVPVTVVLPGQYVPVIVGAVELDRTVIDPEAELTHFPVSV